MPHWEAVSFLLVILEYRRFGCSTEADFAWNVSMRIVISMLLTCSSNANIHVSYCDGVDIVIVIDISLAILPSFSIDYVARAGGVATRPPGLLIACQLFWSVCG